jgi:SAM-dependent methyltransferase
MAMPTRSVRHSESPTRDNALARCSVCEATQRVLCDEEEVRRQRHIAFQFHQRRLERRARAELNERALFTQDEAVPLLQCAGCGLVSRWQIPGAAQLEHTYAEDTYPEDRLVEMLAAQVSLFRRKVPVLRRLLGRPRRILEVGSFVGGFLDVAHTSGWDAIGVDPGRQLVDWCRERGRRVYAGTLEEFAVTQSVMAVDCLAIWNTFDQLPDPRPTLELAARFVTRGGILAIRVPHGDCYRALLARRATASPLTQRFWTACLAWNNLLSFPHLYGYGIASLDRLVAPFGFERVAVQGDVLVTLAGRATAAWARAEEEMVKRAQLAWIRRGARSGKLDAAPWLDVYWRRS